MSHPWPQDGSKKEKRARKGAPRLTNAFPPASVEKLCITSRHLAQIKCGEAALGPGFHSPAQTCPQLSCWARGLWFLCIELPLVVGICIAHCRKSSSKVVRDGLLYTRKIPCLHLLMTVIPFLILAISPTCLLLSVVNPHNSMAGIVLILQIK